MRKEVQVISINTIIYNGKEYRNFIMKTQFYVHMRPKSIHRSFGKGNQIILTSYRHCLHLLRISLISGRFSEMCSMAVRKFLRMVSMRSGYSLMAIGYLLLLMMRFPVLWDSILFLSTKSKYGRALLKKLMRKYSNLTTQFKEEFQAIS